jgi:hypothetical protein
MKWAKSEMRMNSEGKGHVVISLFPSVHGLNHRTIAFAGFIQLQKPSPFSVFVESGFIEMLGQRFAQRPMHIRRPLTFFAAISSPEKWKHLSVRFVTVANVYAV